MNIRHYVGKGRRTVIAGALLGLATVISSTSYAA
ncbi:MAG: ABC transporter substrate-binding protein, partial [Acinetobacter sp.]|nr:ABC transporter substrate-binding protein [Acinetobacter sp.]